MTFNPDLKHTCMISLYLKLPQKPRFLYEVEGILEQRLKLYKVLQVASQKYKLHKRRWIEHILEEMLDKDLVDFLFLLDPYQTLCSDVEELNIIKFDSLEEYYEDDQTGHFILALVCSTSEELKKLFLNLETQWFQMKFDFNVPEDSIAEFLRHQNIILPEASAEDMLAIKNELSFYGLSLEAYPPLVFKIPFVEASDMLTDRQVLIKDGFLYFPNKHKYVSLFLQHFVRTKWRVKLKNLSKYWVNPNKEERIEELVNIILPYVKKLVHYSGQLETSILTSKTINEHSRKLFPLCMSQLHCLLQKKHHLKHYARNQYAVFLKNAGMPFEDAIELFESEMTQQMSKEDFIKRRYFYYFSHCYGRVGGRIDYLPQSCQEIIDNVPSENQEHGCPFAHYSEDLLKATLASNNVRKQSISYILEQTRKKQYRNACCVYFIEKVGLSLNFVPSPNNYFVCALDSCNIVDIEDIFAD